MQLICSDMAHINGHSYVMIADRYTYWISIYKANKAKGLISPLRNHFITFGAPEELTNDGGPEYTSVETEEFLNKWKVNHRLTSAYYPRANLRAKLGVKVAKRLLRENVRNDGSLDMDKVARALLTHRNTPFTELKMSPDHLLFGRNLRDYLPAVKCEGTIGIKKRMDYEPTRAGESLSA